MQRSIWSSILRQWLFLSRQAKHRAASPVGRRCSLMQPHLENLKDLFFNHPLTANYSDRSTNVVASTGASMTMPLILLVFFFFESAEQFQTMTLI
jgi:hypothetical protein